MPATPCALRSARDGINHPLIFRWLRAGASPILRLGSPERGQARGRIVLHSQSPVHHFTIRPVSWCSRSPSLPRRTGTYESFAAPMNALNRTILAAVAWWLVAAAALLFVAMIVLLP